MPTIDVDIAEFERLLGLHFRGNMEKLDDVLAFVKSEAKMFTEPEGIVSIEIKDTNRPDLWGVEGLARALRGYTKVEEGLREYAIAKTGVNVEVDDRLKNIRPFIACSTITGNSLNDTIIRGLMHLQDKLDQTYGRNRQKTSIGIYDLDLISPPLKYTVANPHDFAFVPLGFSEKMSLDEILERHPKGIEYGHIVKKHSVYPILLDAEEKVLSFPPIINSNDLGRITETTRNLLIEVTGTQLDTVLNTLKLVTLSLIDRGGKPSASTIHYLDGDLEMTTPDFGTKQVDLNVEYSNKIIGLKLSAKKIAELLTTAGFGIEKVTDENVIVLVPCYRIDIMHPIDLVEDVAIAYGFNNIEPIWRDLPTVGSVMPEQRFVDVTRELMTGLGYQEILTYTMTNPDNLFSKMNTERTRLVEIANPKVVTLTCLRNWLLPGVMEFLSNNQSVEFPQKVFELGKVTLIDENRETKTRDENWVAAATSHSNASFSEIKAALNSLFINLGLDWNLEATSHPSFIEGRTGNIIVEGKALGVFGELNPRVLQFWKLENPAAAFEMNAEKIFKAKNLSKR